MKFGTQSRSSSLIINVIFGIVDLDPKLKKLGRFDHKVAMCSIFMKFDTQNKSNMPIMNIVLGMIILTQNYRFGQIWS